VALLDALFDALLDDAEVLDPPAPAEAPSKRSKSSTQLTATAPISATPTHALTCIPL
jgi:hypothetical protein